MPASLPLPTRPDNPVSGSCRRNAGNIARRDVLPTVPTSSRLPFASSWKYCRHSAYNLHKSAFARFRTFPPSLPSRDSRFLCCSKDYQIVTYQNSVQISSASRCLMKNGEGKGTCGITYLLYRWVIGRRRPTPIAFLEMINVGGSCWRLNSLTGCSTLFRTEMTSLAS